MKKQSFAMQPNRLRRLLSLAVVASSLLVACSSASKQPSKDVSVSTGQVQQNFATATDGARIEYFTHGTPSAQTVVISPAFTGSAQLYAEKFGKALPDNFVVAVQLRGHGQGGGCTYRMISICTQEQAPDKGTYSGFRISRLAEDLPTIVNANVAYQNAKKNSDKQNARVEHDKALNDAIVSIMNDDTELFKQFMDNDSFKSWLTNQIFEQTYSEEDAA
jgi:hypothetical protein